MWFDGAACVCISIPNRNNTKTTHNRPVERTIFAKVRDQVLTSARERYGGKSGLKNVAKDVAMLKSLLNTENKRLDTLSTAISLTVSGSVSWIASPSQGDDNNARNGRSIKIDRIDMVLLTTWNSGTTSLNDDQWVRWFVVVYLKTPSTSGSTPFSLAEFLNADPNANRTVLSLPNTDTAENFRILDQGLFKVPQNFNNTISSSITESSMSVSVHQTFSGTAGTNIADNSLFFVAVPLNAFGTGGQCNILPQFRVWYVDN
jgi:hypothetical protein